MDDFDPVELERIRRWGRPDWRRFVRPDWGRFVHPAGHEAMRKQHAMLDRAFEHPSARRLREARAAEERAEQIALERKLAAIQQEYEARERAWKAECAERKRKADLAWERIKAAFMRGDLARKANFDPDQPRDELGRWSLGPSSGDSAQTQDSKPTRVAQYSFGTLIGQSRIRGGGWKCFYKFSFGTIMVDGATNLGCSSWVTSMGVSHGKLIANDN